MDDNFCVCFVLFALLRNMRFNRALRVSVLH